MSHIVVMFSLFDTKQKIYVYVNGEYVRQVSVDSNEVISAVDALRNEYGIDIIDLFGNIDYCTKYKEKMLSNYSNIKEVNVIQG